MIVQVDIDRTSQSEPAPTDEDIHRWIDTAVHLLIKLAQNQPHPNEKISCKKLDNHCEVSVCIVDDAEMTLLNERYRHIKRPTNVLSFPADLPDEVDLPLLGDIAICANIVNQEAQQQAKENDAHWAHMLVHGTLHLLGYDHIDEKDAELMEDTEREILHHMGFPDPYQDASCNNPQFPLNTLSGDPLSS